jgi:hypothetical protein
LQQAFHHHFGTLALTVELDLLTALRGCRVEQIADLNKRIDWIQ